MPKAKTIVAVVPAGDTPPSYPKQKLYGVVDDEIGLDSLAEWMGRAGVRDIEVLSAAPGIQLLSRMLTAFSNEEDRVLQTYIDELRAGRIVFAVDTATLRADLLAQYAARGGARHLVHFGTWIISDVTT